MKTSNRTIAMFHIGRGGQFHNQGHLTFVDFKPINECYDWDRNTYNTLDEDGMPNLSDGSGNELLSPEDLKKALETGIGRLDFDGDYDTTYTTYVDELTESELRAMAKQPAAYGVKEALKEFGYSDLEISLATYFDDFENLVTFQPDSNYVSWEYEEAVVEPEDVESYTKINGKFYYEN